MFFIVLIKNRLSLTTTVSQKSVDDQKCFIFPNSSLELPARPQTADYWAWGTEPVSQQTQRYDSYQAKQKRPNAYSGNCTQYILLVFCQFCWRWWIGDRYTSLLVFKLNSKQ